MNSQLKFAAAVMAAAVAASTALADRVNLKSGSFLTGKAGLIQNGKLAFEADDIGEIKIDVKNIVSIEAEGQTHVVQYEDMSTETVPLTVTDGEYTVDGEKLNMDGVKAIDPEEETWHGSVNLAFQADRGNTYAHSISFLANLHRRWEKDRFNADFGYHYNENGKNKDDSKTTKNALDLEAQHDHFWTAKFYSYENGKYDRDLIAGIDYRVRLGAGGGWQWLDGYECENLGKWSFNQEVGAAWTKVGYKEEPDDTDTSYCSVHYAHHLKFLPVFNDTVEAFHNLQYDPAIDDWEIYTMEADIGFTVKIWYDFDLLCKAEWDYNSRPSRGRKSSDTRYIVGLGYKW